jgi:hypothetical protein
MFVSITAASKSAIGLSGELEEKSAIQLQFSGFPISKLSAKFPQIPRRKRRFDAEFGLLRSPLA